MIFVQSIIEQIFHNDRSILDRKKVREKERKREGRILAENEEKKKYWRRIEIATAAVAIAAK